MAGDGPLRRTSLERPFLALPGCPCPCPFPYLFLTPSLYLSLFPCPCPPSLHGLPSIRGKMTMGGRDHTPCLCMGSTGQCQDDWRVLRASIPLYDWCFYFAPGLVLALGYPLVPPMFAASMYPFPDGAPFPILGNGTHFSGRWSGSGVSIPTEA